MISQVLSHYRILNKIGSGGMGDVYLAEDASLGRQVALKLLPVHLTGDHDRVRRFKQEARAASALNHPNILTVHEIGEADGHHFIATEFIEGETLRHHLKESRIESKEALDISGPRLLGHRQTCGGHCCTREGSCAQPIVLMESWICVCTRGSACRCT